MCLSHSRGLVDGAHMLVQVCIGYLLGSTQYACELFEEHYYIAQLRRYSL